MAEQLELPLNLTQPKPRTTKSPLRLRGIGVIRSNLDTGHLMSELDRIGNKHSGGLLSIGVNLDDMDIDMDDFDMY